MTRLNILCVVVLLITLTLCGCAVQDWVFAAFSDNYSAGGTSTYEKQDHFNREMDRARNQQQNGSDVVSDVPWH